MLQRIYGTAWAKKEICDAYLYRLEEAGSATIAGWAGSRPLPPADEAPAWCSGTRRGWTLWQQIGNTCVGVYQDNGYP